jgi:hypothetical protein
MTRLLGCLALVALASCQYGSTPIQLQGEPAAIAALTGDWHGEYWSNASERRGSLRFFIGAGADSSFGDVTMFTPMGQLLRPADEGEQHRAHTRLAQSLRIDFARVGGGAVTGTLEPYIAPDCNCTVSTTFTGTIQRDTIRGTFATRGESGGSRDGEWRLVRKSPK